VAAGTLVVNPIQGSLAGQVTVSGGTLFAVGSIGGLDATGGTVDPGIDGPAILTSSSDVTLEAGSTLHLDLNGSTPGTDNDELNVVGAVSINQARLDLLTGITPENVPLTIVQATGPVTGNFTSPTTGAVLHTGDTFNLPDGELFQILYGVNTVFVVHLNTASAFQNRSVTSVVTEGSVATLRGTIVEPDPQDSFTLVVSWGDGTPVETRVYPAGSNGQVVTLTHSYANNGTYTVHASWHDPHGAGNSADLQVEVSNVPPVVDAGGDAHLHRGEVLNRQGSFSDPGADTWTATVDFGDGSGPQPLQLGPDHRFHLHHKYHDAGSYVVTVTVRDDDGGVGIDQFVVTVDD
jgi:hypothetical protein